MSILSILSSYHVSGIFARWSNNEHIKDMLRGVINEQEKHLASSTSAGLMSAADKIKLDNFHVNFDSGTLSILTPKGILTFAAIRGTSS